MQILCPVDNICGRLDTPEQEHIAYGTFLSVSSSRSNFLPERCQVYFIMWHINFVTQLSCKTPSLWVQSNFGNTSEIALCSNQEWCFVKMLEKRSSPEKQLFGFYQFSGNAFLLWFNFLCEVTFCQMWIQAHEVWVNRQDKLTGGKSSWSHESHSS